MGEVRHKGVWGSVCGAFFGQEEANVFCKMLGHDRAETGGWREAYGEHEGLREGSWPIWINFHEENPCSGSESSIEQCHNSGAVIISPFHVLTTAHCMYKFREQLNIYY